jgi:hypothetical protein
MKVVFIAALLCAAGSAISAYAEPDVRLTAAQNQFRVTTEQAAEDTGRRSQEVWSRTATQSRGNSVGIATIPAQEERYASGCSR